MRDAQTDPWGERLPRRLGVWSSVAILIGTTIGSGIFRVPAIVAAQTQDPIAALLAWVLGGMFSLCGALTIAELASALPRSGGIFAYILEGFGALPAFLYGWSEMAVIRPAALGGIATICAEYCGYLLPLTAHQVHYLAAVAIAAVGIFNYIGMQRAAVLMNLLTLAKFLTLAALAVLAFTAGHGNLEHFQPVASPAAQLSRIAAPLIPIMWSYDGWSNLSFVGGEVRNPQKTLPTALVLGTVAVITTYVLINAAFVYLLSIPEMASTSLIAAAAASRIPLLRGYGPAMISAIVVISTFGGLVGSMMTGPRVVFAMADRGLLFKGVGRISPRYATPSIAIAISTTLAITYTLLNDFAHLVDKFILGSWPFYALAVAAIFTLRRRRPDLARPYRTWGYPYVPTLFLAASALMVANALRVDPVNTAITFLIVLTGLPVYWFRNCSSVRRNTRP